MGRTRVACRAGHRPEMHAGRIAFKADDERPVRRDRGRPLRIALVEPVDGPGAVGGLAVQVPACP